jgi:WD40 repeat protein
MSNKTRSFSSNFWKLGAVFAVLAFSGCVKQTVIPGSATNTIKEHERVVIYANRLPWTKTDIAVEPGDPILIVASGRVNTLGFIGYQLPYQSLYMKCGKRGYPLNAVGYDDFKFLRVTDSGQLMFRARDLYGRYEDNSGSFVVDVFVFSTPDENRIALALDAVARANPDDHELVSKLRKIADFKGPSSSANQWEKTNEVSPAQPELAGQELHKPQLEEVKDDTSIRNQGFLLKSLSQVGHESTVTSVAFSPDDTCALSGGKDNTLRLWEVATAREIRVFKGHTDFVYSVAFSPDGKTAVSGSNDNTLRLWAVSTGVQISVLRGHTDAVTSAAFSPDGKYILSGSRDRTLRLWDVATAMQVRVFGGHKSSVASVAFSPDGQYALSGSWDDTLRLWKVSDGSQIRIIKGHTDAVTSTAFSSDGKYILSGSRDRTLRLWEVKTGEQVRVFRGHEGLVTSVTFSPDGQYALSGSWDDTLRLWKVSDGSQIKIIKGHTDSVTSATLSSDGEYILSGSRDSTARLWEISTGRQIGVFTGRKKSITSVAFSHDGRRALSGGEDSTLQLWDMSTGDQIRVFKGHSDSVNSVLFLPDGKHVLSGSSDNTLRLWEVTTGRQVRVFRGHEDSVTSVTLSSDGRFALSASSDDTLRLWDVTTGKQIRLFEGHDYCYAAQSLALSPDGSYALSGGYGRVIHSFNIDSGKEIGVFRGYFDRHKRSINSIAFSPDGNYAVSASDDGNLLLWEANTRRLIRVFKGHTDSVTSVVFSLDGEHLLSGGKDNTLRLWEVTTGRQVRVFRGHEDSVTSVAISPDGRQVLSGSADGSIRVWNTRSGKKVVSLYHFSNEEWLVTVPDGYYNSSPEGGPLLYWVFHNGLETFTFEQFESFFKRPDIVKARISGNAKVGTPGPSMTSPPRIDSPDHMAFKEINTKTYRLVLTVSALEEVKTLRVFVNGKPTLEVPVNAKKKKLSLDVPLFSGGNRITAVAYDEKGFSSNPKYVDVICKHAGLAKPNLYVFAIGISNYPRLAASWQLEFAHTDAKALIEALKNQEGKLFDEVRYNFLSNEKATVQTINDVLDALSGIDENDLAVIFMAGHGVKAQDSTFYFLTSDGNFEEPQRGGLSWTVLGEHLARIKARVILLLDACHSGSIVTETVVPNDELAQQFFTGGRGGIMVFSASKGRQYSLESPDIGSGFGIFTYAVTQSLGPKAREADTNNDGFVEFMELVDYVSTYVNKETKGEQTPWLSRKELFGDLPVARVN